MAVVDSIRPQGEVSGSSDLSDIIDCVLVPRIDALEDVARMRDRLGPVDFGH